MGNKKVRYLLFSNYLNLFAFSFFTPLFAIFVLHLNKNPEIIGIAWGVNMYAAAVMILLFGRYENSMKHKEKLVVVGFFLLALGAAAYILVNNIWELFFVQLFNAVGTGILTPAWRTTYAASEDRGKEAQEWSFVDGGAKFFSATGAVAGGFILKYYSFRTIFVLIALMQLGAAIIALRLLETRRRSPRLAAE